MKVISKPFRFLYVIYACILFVVLMIIVFIFSIIALFFGRIKGGNMIYYACRAWADIWLFMTGIRHQKIYIGGKQGGRSFIYVANHISYLDSAVIPKTFRKPVRPLGKVEMSKIPVFGFIYKNVIVTVDRSSTENRARSVELLKSIIRKGISVLVFPEGTFNTTHQPLKKFYDGAFRIAIETGTPIRPVLFLDNYDRMHYDSVFCLNPGRCRAVFLAPITVDGLTMDDTAALRDKIFSIMEEALLSYNVSWARAEKTIN